MSATLRPHGSPLMLSTPHSRSNCFLSAPSPHPLPRSKRHGSDDKFRGKGSIALPIPSSKKIRNCVTPHSTRTPRRPGDVAIRCVRRPRRGALLRSRPAAFGCLLLILLAVAGTRPAASAAAPDQETPPVKLRIDYGDGVEKWFTRIPWSAGMTVLSATEAAHKHPRGIRFKHRGKGATAFLYEIDDLENEPRGRAWLFRVNGKRGTTSCGVAPLQSGDTVIWEFGKY